MITNLHLHPEAPSLVITSSLDGTIKIFSLDIMEEIYRYNYGFQCTSLVNFTLPVTLPVRPVSYDVQKYKSSL